MVRDAAHLDSVSCLYVRVTSYRSISTYDPSVTESYGATTGIAHAYLGCLLR